MKKVINYNHELKELKELIDKVEFKVIKNPNNEIIKQIFNHLLKRFKRLCKNERQKL